PVWFKRTLVGLGAALMVPGLLFTLMYCVITLVSLFDDYADDAVAGGVSGLALTALTLGAGGVTFWHGLRSLKHKPSKSLRLPPIWTLVGVFGVCAALAGAVFTYDIAAGLLFPPLFLLAAALPPLWAVAWFFGRDLQASGLTWRRGLTAMAGGATLGVFVAILLEILLPGIVLALVLDFAQSAARHVEDLMTALAGQNIAEALTNPTFLYAFAQLALIAPLAEEIAKPLVTLPLLKRLTRREAFWVGALAGVGFAALENVLYAGFGLPIWAGILVVRALGGAIHPLGAGLMALGWRDWLCGEPGAGRVWAKRFGLAAGMHALWNGGSLIVLTLGGAKAFGALPPDVEVLGFAAGGTVLALLVTLGLAALWLGRATVNALGQPVEEAVGTAAIPALSDRAVAIWALACLVAIVPAGVAGLKLLFW
ncbi:MAG TPA: PrsW family glutamic-type intramembrane protease, partial [Anaerolineae bacterium]|nr:PrsW family glutamic-type intramembrane protease [Anaerolineae bacterium]